MAASASDIKMPKPNQAYPLKIGPTIRKPSTSRSFVTLKYSFKPRKTDQSQPGSLELSGNTASVKFCRKTGNDGLLFTGRKSAPPREGKPVEYLVIFKDGKWVLERCKDSFLGMRTVPGGVCEAPVADLGDGEPVNLFDESDSDEEEERIEVNRTGRKNVLANKGYTPPNAVDNETSTVTAPKDSTSSDSASAAKASGIKTSRDKAFGDKKSISTSKATSNKASSVVGQKVDRQSVGGVGCSLRSVPASGVAGGNVKVRNTTSQNFSRPSLPAPIRKPAGKSGSDQSAVQHGTVAGKNSGGSGTVSQCSPSQSLPVSTRRTNPPVSKRRANLPATVRRTDAPTKVRRASNARIPVRRAGGGSVAVDNTTGRDLRAQGAGGGGVAVQHAARGNVGNQVAKGVLGKRGNGSGRVNDRRRKQKKGKDFYTQGSSSGSESESEKKATSYEGPEYTSSSETGTSSEYETDTGSESDSGDGSESESD